MIEEFVNGLESFLHEFAADIAKRTQPVEVRRYNGHEFTRYADGRFTCLSPRRWLGDREQPLPPTPYELLQLVGDMPPLCPGVMDTIVGKALIGAGMVAAVAALPLFFGRRRK